MPITPAEAEIAARDRRFPNYQYHCERIDKMLIDGSRNYGVAIVDKLLVEELIDSYRSAGWRVQLISDWRDGDYLEFIG